MRTYVIELDLSPAEARDLLIVLNAAAPLLTGTDAIAVRDLQPVRAALVAALRDRQIVAQLAGQP